MENESKSELEREYEILRQAMKKMCEWFRTDLSSQLADGVSADTILTANNKNPINEYVDKMKNSSVYMGVSEEVFGKAQKTLEQLRGLTVSEINTVCSIIQEVTKAVAVL